MLRLHLAKLKRLSVGLSSERRDSDQLMLAFEAIEEEIAHCEAAASASSTDQHDTRRASRLPLPAHLPREEARHEPERCRCSACGGALHVIGED